MQSTIKGLLQKNASKIVLFVMDGLGGLPSADPKSPFKGKTELEAAFTPNLDKLAKSSACGLHVPVGFGITPGSGPGHLGLFGYDPLEWEIGRGILEALGLGLEVKRTDVAIRCNYATVEDHVVTDRRAGRPPTEKMRKVTERLQKQIPGIDGVRLIFGAGMEHRFAVIMRFPEALPPEAAMINDSDPQAEGRAPLPLIPRHPKAEKVAEIAQKFIDKAVAALKDEHPQNFVLVRGFSTHPRMPSFSEAYGLRGLAIASYPMYRGLARLMGMNAPDFSGDIAGQIEYMKDNWNDYDFFFVHFKKTDSFGEDGNFAGKVSRIEEADRALPAIRALKPDVLIITGDHSTPAVMKSHSWHPVPVMLSAPYVLGAITEKFSERECVRGELGIIPSVSLMPLALANAGRLKKFGS
ncbi:MAG: 2,3-bisphosphoglycerate-independent phosphoglycerate mutase [Nitrospiraceae bacterium]|nr:2,3-bisphosphoglycerate-independent phosphoglycerate mutase [Nitrospiraceae bacterium]